MIMLAKYGVSIKILFCLSLIFCTLYFVPYTVHGQVLQGSGISLASDIKFPTPYSPVTISLDDYQFETTGATITWYVDGAERVDNKNNRSIQLETGGLGKKTTVRVVVSRTNSPVLSSSLEITPTVVDIILEADTYTPSFYKGRALPSVESNVRALAVVLDGTKTPDSAYTYKWSKSGKVLLGGAIKGKNTYAFTMPLFPSDWLSVEVYDSMGRAIGEKSLPLVSIAPELHFYEQSPLRGLFQKEIKDKTPLIGEETTIYGEPYFIDATMNTNEADFSWKINGTKTVSDSESPNAITLRHTGGEGSARIGFSVVSKKHVPQFVEKIFTLLFE